MTLADVYEQAKQLSADERKELVKMLVDTLGARSEAKDGRGDRGDAGSNGRSG